MSSGLSARGHGPAVPRILLVDDDRDLLVPLAEQLRLDGFDRGRAPVVTFPDSPFK